MNVYVCIECVCARVCMSECVQVCVCVCVYWGGEGKRMKLMYIERKENRTQNKKIYHLKISIKIESSVSLEN